MKLIEYESEINGESTYQVELSFTDAEIPEFLEELKKRPRLMKAVYRSLVEAGYMTPHGEC